MNVVLIPFLLAANVPGAESWVHGPEYVFQANLTYLLSIDEACEPFAGSDLSALMRCRPKSEDSLVCIFADVVFTHTHIDNLHACDLPYPFLIKFNRRGVQGIGFPKEWKSSDNYYDKVVNVVRRLAKELSVGVDLTKHADNLPSFVEQEEYVLGECPTLFAVRQFYTPLSRMVDNTGRKRTYTLAMLTLYELEATSNVIIEKSTEHRKCTNLDDNSYVDLGVDIKIGRSTMKIQFNNDGAYRSKTEMHVKGGKPPGSTDPILQEITSLELLDIVQATEELPAYSFDDFFALRYNSRAEENYVL